MLSLIKFKEIILSMSGSIQNKGKWKTKWKYQEKTDNHTINCIKPEFRDLLLSCEYLKTDEYFIY